MAKSKRQTGRSTKQLLRALLAAIRGRDAVFVVKNDILADYCDECLIRWAQVGYVSVPVLSHALPNAFRGLTFKLHRLKKGEWVVMRLNKVALLQIVTANNPRGPISVYLDHRVMGQE